MRILTSLAVAALVAAGCGPDNVGAGIDGGGGGGDLHAGGGDLAGLGVDGGGCGLRTCASAGANCGPIGDGCGGVIDCGTCTAPETCGGGGKPSVCGGTMGCVPRTCQSVGANCGPVADGCGGLLDCGSCPMGQSCGLQKPNVCATGSGGNTDGGGACVPKTCQQLGFNCGPAGDGCGGLLNCGTCPMGQACGNGGKPSVCGPANSCTPKTCQQLGYTCGMDGDGCGGIINCGSCQSPNICGGGGVANQCGSNVGTDGGTCTNLCLKQAKCDMGTTTITGTVLAPTNPNLGYGNPDPIYNALVYIPNGTVMPFTAGVSCDKCGADVTGDPLVTFTTGVDGKFTLTNAPCGTNIPLVIQVGRWRRQIVIPSVACCANTALTADQTRLPRNHTEGDIPLFAVVTGNADPIECVLPKIGIDLTEFTLPSGTGRVRFYISNGADLGNNTPSADTLYNSPTELAKYDAIIADCEASQIDKTTGQQTNVINYTNVGGRMFASHYSYTWLYNDAPFSTTAQWNVDQTYPPDLTAFIDQNFPKGIAFATWLKNIGASQTLGQIPVQAVRHDLDAVNNPPAQEWMHADPNVSPNNPVEYTFNTPVTAMPQNQCGRVLFSDFHVNTGGNGFGKFPGECNGASPMTPQEKVLEFMLFDLTSCIQPDMPTCTPRTCTQQGFNCGAAGDGCGNVIQCGTCPMGQICGGGGPNKCGPACTPLTCQQQGIQCGPAGDGCGGQLDCGTCPMGQTCGGGGMPGVCGTGSCTPITCQQQGLMCGPAGDGCGNKIDCGTCPMGQTCGGGGMPGVCGMTSCTPITCQSIGANCGLIGDGCGGTIDCGTCPQGQTCGGGGQANVCGGIG